MSALLFCTLFVSFVQGLPVSSSEDMRFRRRLEGDWKAPKEIGKPQQGDGLSGCSVNMVAPPEGQKLMQPATASIEGSSFTFPDCTTSVDKKECAEKTYTQLEPTLKKAQEVFSNNLLELVISLNKAFGTNPSTPWNALKKDPMLHLAHVVVVPPKGKDRSVEKALEYGGNFRRVIDILRASIIFPDFSTLAKAVCLMRQLNAEQKLGFSIVREKDGLNGQDPSGYMDYKFSLSIPLAGGLVGEVQFLVCSMFYAKMAMPGLNGHKIYEEFRTSTDANKRAALVKESQKLYSLYTPDGAKFREGTIQCVDAFQENMDTFVLAWDTASRKMV